MLRAKPRNSADPASETGRSAEKSLLSVVSVSKSFRGCRVLEDISLDIMPGEFLCLLGPSGCGKTTLLRIIAGLEKHDSGHVFFGGLEYDSVPASLRNFGMVFQSYALFPNLTAFENVAYGLRSRRVRGGELKNIVNGMLETVGLSDRAGKYPAQLSGGEQQRVALARVLVLSPVLLLLDEPLSALDAKVRVKLRGDIKELKNRLGITTIMVTHDQEEALTMADRVAVMNGGKVVQVGTPREVYENPADMFVADFVGSMNFVEFEGDDDPLRTAAETAGRGKAKFAVRPEYVRLCEGRDGLACTVTGHEFRGATYRVRLRLPGRSERFIEADVPVHGIDPSVIKRGASVSVNFPAERVLVF